MSRCVNTEYVQACHAHFGLVFSDVFVLGLKLRISHFRQPHYSLSVNIFSNYLLFLLNGPYVWVTVCSFFW